MSRNLFLAAVVLGLAFALGGCDSKKPAAEGGGAAPAVEKGAGAGPAAGPGARTAQPGPPQAMLDLIPEGAVAIAWVPSLKAVEETAQRIATAAGAGEEASGMNVGVLVKNACLEAPDVDVSRGGAVVMTLAKGTQEPGMTMIVPVKDEKAAAAKFKARNAGGTVETAGGFAAMTKEHAGAYKRGGLPAKLAGPLPQADVVVRADMATLGRVFGPMVFDQWEQMFAAMQEMSSEGPESGLKIGKSVVDGLKAAVEATSVCDVAIRAEGTAVELDVTFVFGDASKAPALRMFGKSNLAKLAHGLPDGAMIDVAAAVDFEKAWPAYCGFLKNALGDYYPDKQRGAMTRLLNKLGGLSKTMGQGAVATITFGGGMAMTCIMDSPDPSAYFATLSEVYSGLDVKELDLSPVEDRTVDGTSVKSWKMKMMDVEKLPSDGSRGAGQRKAMLEAMYGKGSFAINAANLGNRVLLVVGSDDALKRGIAAAKGETQSALSKALTNAGPDTAGYVRWDLRAMVNMAMAAMAAGADGPPPAGEPVNLTAIANVGPDRFRTRLRLDVGQVMEMFKDLRGK